MSKLKLELFREQSDAALFRGGATLSPTGQLLIDINTGTQYDDLHAEMELFSFKKRIKDLRTALKKGQIGNKSLKDISLAWNPDKAIKTEIISIAERLHEIYQQAPPNLSPFDFMSEYIAQDIAYTIYWKIDLYDYNMTNYMSHRGIGPAVMLLIAYDRIRTNGNDKDKFDSNQWNTLFRNLDESLYPRTVITKPYDLRESIQQSVQLLEYQPVRQ